MISDPKNLTEQLQNLSERIAIEMRALNRTKVSKINGVIPDNNGEVTIANATTSASGLMSASDKSKLGGIAEGANNYSLPTASSSQFGGVKTGSNITNNSGTISVSKKNVTDALGYTPLQTAPVSSVDGKTGAIDLSGTYQPKGNYLTSAPVSSVNGKTGAVTIDVGVTSFNGSTGAVTYTAPVTSVNGKTGAVTIDVGTDYTLPTATNSVLGGVKTGSNITNTNGTISITSSNVTNALGYTPLKTAPVTSVNGQTGAVSIDVGVKTVNGTQPDSDGNVTIEVSGGGSGEGIPRTGNRGFLGGYNTLNYLNNPSQPVVINGLTNDDTFIVNEGGSVNVNFEVGGAETWCKQVFVFNQGGMVTLNVPSDGSIMFDTASETYEVGMIDLLVYVWYGEYGMGLIYTKNIF